MLGSLKVVHKATPPASLPGRRPSPDPQPGTSVEMRCRLAPRLINLAGIAEVLSRQCPASKQAPPALDQVKPAGFSADEHLLDTRTGRQPLSDGTTLVTGQINRDQIGLARGAPSMTLSNATQPAVLRAVAVECDRLPITVPQRLINPGIVKPRLYSKGAWIRCPSVDQPGGRQTGGALLVQVHQGKGRRVLWWADVEPGGCRSFERQSESVLLAQGWVYRQGTPSAKKMRRA